MIFVRCKEFDWCLAVVEMVQCFGSLFLILTLPKYVLLQSSLLVIMPWHSHYGIIYKICVFPVWTLQQHEIPPITGRDIIFLRIEFWVKRNERIIFRVLIRDLSQRKMASVSKFLLLVLWSKCVVFKYLYFLRQFLVDLRERHKFICRRFMLKRKAGVGAQPWTAWSQNKITHGNERTHYFG